MKNPIIDEFKKLKLISEKDVIIFKEKTRNNKIRVLKDLKSKIIFLEKFITDHDYYSASNYKDGRKFLKKTRKTILNVKTTKGKIKTDVIPDDLRRVDQFEKILKNKDILDFGCSWGGFLNNIKNYKSLNGVELRKECIKFIKKNIRKITIKEDVMLFKKKFDIITMFHVLEHIPFQVNMLKILKSKLKKKGKIVIEVPHAEDFLILQDELTDFRSFTFWSEHLILHTYRSLVTILKKAGFKKINIQFYQRYDLANHLGWFLQGKPNGHINYKNIINEKLNRAYQENLKKIKQTDTLIAIAE